MKKITLIVLILLPLLSSAQAFFGIGLGNTANLYTGAKINQAKTGNAVVLSAGIYAPWKSTNTPFMPYAAAGYQAGWFTPAIGIAHHSYSAPAKEFYNKTSGTHLLTSLEIGKDINSGKVYTQIVYSAKVVVVTVGIKYYFN